MRCPICDTDNREGAKFCNECAHPFGLECPRCGAVNVPAAKFCDNCRASLNAAGGVSAAAAIPLVSAPEVVGERRHLTILFCDLVGSVTLAAQVDPEEWRATVTSYQLAASEAITRFGGEVMRYVGDGIMAFFGYPVAHDNDAERAARTGLAILDTIAKLNESQSGRPKLSLRIGIDSGSVVVGTGAGQAVDAFGDAANIAARVQSAAEPDMVVVTDATHRLTSGLFVIEDHGAQQLKGVERPVRLYRIVRPSGVRDRFEAAAAGGGLVPFIGREEELHLLLNRWRRVRDGEGQAVLVLGEAGIGKSRLVRRFSEEIATEPHTWLAAGAGAFFQNTPFHPISELLQQTLTEGDPVSQLASRLTAVGLNAADALPLLAPMLNLTLPPEYPPSSLAPEQQRRRLLATLVEWLIGAARTQPVVSVVEDLHWADPSTLELIALMVEQGARAPLLLLYTARPEFRPSWPLRAHHLQLTLNRLSAREVRVMVGEVSARKAISDDTVTTVVERTGGVPLFVEELTRALLEAGDGKLSERTIPATLHDSLMARLDRLGAAKEVAQVGAVIGRDFTYELLHTVHPIAETDLQHALRRLTDTELLHVRGIAPEATYQFKHALIRDAAYEALLKSRRQQLHQRIAEVLEIQFSPTVDARSELLAHHYTEAGLPERAVPYWQLAGQRASDRSANVEAIRYFTIGIELLNKTPDSLERKQTELALQTALGAPLQTLKGWGDPAVASVYDRAQELCQQIGDTPYLFPTLFGLWRFYLQRGKMQRVLELAQRLLDLAQQQKDAFLLMEAHRVLASTLFFIPDFAAAKSHSEQAIALYDKEQKSARAALFPNPPELVCRLLRSHILWIWGYADQAREQCYEALSLARELSHPANIIYALAWTGTLHQFRREVKETQASVEEELSLLSEQRIPVWLGSAAIRLQWALAMQGRQAGAIEGIHKGLATYRASGSENMRSHLLSMLAEVCAVSGQTTEGQRAISEALIGVEDSGIRYHEAELHRLKGELLLLSRVEKSQVYAQKEAEACFHRAIYIAQQQKAKSWELRATLSLARVWQQQGKGREARQVLSGIYNWFTEGFDTADLKEAKNLLDELST